MKKIEAKLEYNLNLFYQSTQIPFCVFNNIPEAIYRQPQIPSINHSPNPLQQCCQALNNPIFSDHKPIIYSFNLCYIALFKADCNTNIMLGPISPSAITYKEFYDANNNNINPKDLTHLYRILLQSPHMRLIQFANCISLFIQLQFQKNITPKDILADHVNTIPHPTVVDKIMPTEPHYISISEAIDFQKRILFHIRNGNTNEIHKLFEKTNFFLELTVLNSSVTDIQKIYFVYATLCCVAALEEGLDVQKAFPIFDNYINTIPFMHTPKELSQLCQQISVDYSQQITNLHASHSTSSIVNQCLLYIKDNLYQKITLEDLAQHCNTSTRTITRHFTTYYHLSVSECITEQKLNEAIFLLVHSDFSLTEISNQLTFSSQSHFSVAFKKKYCYTPLQYRNKFKR